MRYILFLINHRAITSLVITSKSIFVNKIAKIGEKSIIPLYPNRYIKFLIGAKIGSVVPYTNRAIPLLGLGFIQEKITLINIKIFINLSR